MSAMTAPAPTGPAKLSRPGLGRLTHVELRKMVDTRAGLWLQLIVALLTVAVAIVAIAAGNDSDRTFHGILNIAIQPATFLLPVIGILLVTSEWTQRTALVTFALVPQRGRVLAAKFVASILLGLAVVVLCVLVALVFTAVGGSDSPDRWEIDVAGLAQIVLYLLLAMVTGVAFGVALRSSAPAIVLYYVLPFVMAGLAAIGALEDPLRWVDTTQTTAPLSELGTLSGTEWARLAVSQVLWIGVPMAIGLGRLLKGEVRA